MSLIKKLFNLWDGGKRCEEKKEVKKFPPYIPPPEFIYNDKVKIVDGFYRGQWGFVDNKVYELHDNVSSCYFIPKYVVKVATKDGSYLDIKVFPKEMEKIEDGNSD